MSYCVDDLGPYLEGEWSLSRQVFQGAISTKALGVNSAVKPLMPSTIMRGRASVSGSHYNFGYREEGTLYKGAYHGPFEQYYSMVSDPQNPERAQIFFPDSRPFFVLDLSKGRQSIEHLCGADFYRAIFVAFKISIECTWHVTGPRKNYSLKTLLKKC